MTFYQLSSMINAMAAFAAALLCFLNRPPSKTGLAFSYLSSAVAFWSASASLPVFYPGWDGVNLWRISVLGVIAAPAAFYGFASSFSAKNKGRVKLLKVFAASAAVLAIADLSPLFIEGARAHLPVPGIVFAFAVVYFLAASGAGLKLLLEHYREIPGFGKKEARYLFFASIALLSGLLSNFIFWYGVKAASFGNILVAAGITAAYALTRFSADEIRLTLARAGLFTLIYAVMLSFPFWLGITTSRWLLAVALMGVLASIGPLIYDLLGEKVKDIMLARQKRYQKILIEISQSMVKEHDLDRLVKYIVYAVKKAVRIEFAAMFLSSPGDKAFILKAVKEPLKLHSKFFFSYTHPLISFLREHKRPVRLEELPPSLDGFKDIDLGIRLIVPSLVDERLVCFLLLGDKLDGTDYSDDDVNIFMTLSGQTAQAIENCIYLREFERSQEKIFNADKLASLGGMADGVAHQIKNRLNQFSVAAGEQRYEIDDFIGKHKRLINSNPDLAKTFDYLCEISNSLLDNVKKTSSVIQGVLGFARVEEKGSTFSGFQVEEIIGPTVELLCVKHQISEFPLTTAGGYDLTVYGVKSQIMECLYNILDNSYEAIREKADYHIKDKSGFRPEITLKVSKRERSHVIEISDNGLGIKEENMKKIFAPFFTTKSSFKSGGGVGMYVVKRMIEENHKGRVSVESKYLEGTKVSLELPHNAV